MSIHTACRALGLGTCAYKGVYVVLHVWWRCHCCVGGSLCLHVDRTGVGRCKARHAHKVWPYLVYAWPYLCVCAAAPLLSLKGTASKDTLALQMKHMFFGLD